MLKSPQVVENLLDRKDLLELVNSVSGYKNFNFDPGFSRYMIADNANGTLDNIFKRLTTKARETFGSDTLMPTYALFAHYEGPNASLYRHKDDNACTYTLDMCVYQKEPWDLFVEDKAYTLLPNQALAYYGNDQMHWREDFPNPEENFVAMVFFHYAEPDHWWFTKGPSYLDVVRNIKSEEQWNLENAR
jgi:hypothetical protein